MTSLWWCCTRPANSPIELQTRTGTQQATPSTAGEGVQHDNPLSLSGQRTRRSSDCAFSEGAAENSGAGKAKTPRAAAATQRITVGQLVECTAEELFAELEFRQFLGRGAFASVLAGSWLGSDVAVKVCVTPNKDTASFLREALLAPQLSHQHIVQTYLTRTAFISAEHWRNVTLLSAPGTPCWNQGVKTVGEGEEFDSGHGFGPGARKACRSLLDVYMQCDIRPDSYVTLVVMEVCDKGTLGDAIRKGMFHSMPKWSELLMQRALLRCVHEISKGLMYLHNKCNVVHGDLKPANVLLKSFRGDKRGFTCKLSDFGLSHVLADKSSEASETLGTVAYMSPEHVNGRVTKACDVWSLGMVINHMLVGSCPFKRFSPPQIAIGLMTGELRPEWPDGSSFAGMVQIGQTCTRAEPSERPTIAVVEAMLRGLEDTMRQEGQRSLSSVNDNFGSAGSNNNAAAHHITRTSNTNANNTSNTNNINNNNTLPVGSTTVAATRHNNRAVTPRSAGSTATTPHHQSSAFTNMAPSSRESTNPNAAITAFMEPSSRGSTNPNVATPAFMAAGEGSTNPNMATAFVAVGGGSTNPNVATLMAAGDSTAATSTIMCTTMGMSWTTGGGSTVATSSTAMGNTSSANASMSTPTLAASPVMVGSNSSAAAAAMNAAVAAHRATLLAAAIGGRRTRSAAMLVASGGVAPSITPPCITMPNTTEGEIAGAGGLASGSAAGRSSNTSSSMARRVAAGGWTAGGSRPTEEEVRSPTSQT